MTAQIVAESVSERLTLKAYGTATIDANSEPAAGTDPAATGGQIWRHAEGFKMALGKQSYSPDEIRIDQQQPIDKTGTKSLSVSVPTLLSCLTHKTPMEAVLGGTWTSSAVTADQTDFTSVAADNATSKFTFAGGDPVSKGLRVGYPIRFSSLSEAENNSKNFIVLSFGGTSNREVTVYPAPTDMGADTSFSVSTAGRVLIAPTAGPTLRKFAIEEYDNGPDIARLGTEIRFGGMDAKFAANAIATLDFTGMGRNLIPYASASAPFFSGPTAQTTTDVIDSMQGVMLIGSLVLPVTGLSVSFQRSLSALPQVRSDGLAAGITASKNAVISGDFSVWMTDTTAEQAFLDGTEAAILAYLPASNADAAPAQTWYLPRCLTTGADPSRSNGGKMLTFKYSAGRPSTPGTGVADSSIQICDTEVT